MMSLIATCCLTTVLAQKTVISQKDQKEEPFNVVEDMPAFPGGIEAMIQFLSSNIKYPADAQKQKVDGRVLVTFVVEKDGSITEVNVVKLFNETGGAKDFDQRICHYGEDYRTALTL